MNGSIFEVIVVGAGHAGLSAAYYLKHLGLEHIIFERGRIGDTWRTQRWNNFRMITPDRLNILQGGSGKLKTPDQFSSAGAFVNTLKDYVNAYQLPVTENATVLSIEKAPGAPTFTVKVSHEGDMVRSYECWQVIVASGIMNRKVVPDISNRIHASIRQIHSIEYKSASDLPDGAVLIVGGGQSGLDIANDLIDAGRRVFLSSGGSPMISRGYRGKDALDWQILTGEMDEKSDTLGSELPPEPVMSNTPEVPYLNLSFLAAKGVTLLGPLDSANATHLSFSSGANEIIAAGNHYDVAWRQRIDAYIDAQRGQGNDDFPPEEIELKSDKVSEIKSLDFKGSNISTIVWATGYTGNFDFVKFPVLDENGIIRHRDGITAVDGLYVVGFPWLSSRRSGFIFGSKEDASRVANRAYSALR